jgi:hypothetical protein
MRKLLALVLLLTGGAASPAQAQLGFPAYDVSQLRPFPALPSTRDTRYIGYHSSCGNGFDSPALLRQTAEHGWVLSVRPLYSVCFATPPEGSARLHLIRLPDDLRTGRIRLEYPGPPEPFLQEIPLPTVDRIPPSAAGTWYDPARSGQGIYLSNSPLPAGGPRHFGAAFHYDGFTLMWATFGPDGKPLWLVGTHVPGGYVAPFEMYEATGGVFPSRTGVATPSRAWGRVTLEYESCGRMTMRWEALDAAAFPPGSMTLEQLTTDASHPCDPVRYARGVDALPVIVPAQYAVPATSP